MHGMNTRVAILLLVAIAFTAYTGIIVADQGYLGFLTVARREPWAMQMLLDLTIVLVLFLFWAYGDARQRGLPYWPFAVATVALGSIGALGYLIARSIKTR
jgi:hypothetical protein